MELILEKEQDFLFILVNQNFPSDNFKKYLTDINWKAKWASLGFIKFITNLNQVRQQNTKGIQNTINFVFLTTLV